ncbi:MAG: DUF2939 domain-containing protein [Roseococcus sp.]|nr:DUF2939 domain-containing protein [Roseococcus sp.]
MSRVATWDARLWDEVWAEYDARRPAQPAPAPRTVGPAALGLLPATTRLRPAPRPARPVAPRRPWRLAACSVVAVLLAYAASPVAAALQLAGAAQRADVPALAAQADFERLRPAIAARLDHLAAERLEGAAPAYLHRLREDLSARLASPEGLGALLARQAPPGSGPAPGWVQAAQPLEGGRWSITLAPPEAPARTATLTLALADPLRLRWQLVDLDWAAPRP